MKNLNINNKIQQLLLSQFLSAWHTNLKEVKKEENLNIINQFNEACSIINGKQKFTNIIFKQVFSLRKCLCATK